MKCNSMRSNAPKYKGDGKYRKLWLQEATTRFDEWLTLIQTVPTPYKTLTEDEWIAACKHFGKCALCKNEGIDARAYFIAYAFGGRYAAWNVIPVCEKCATAIKKQQNPFIRYNCNLSVITANDAKGILSGVTDYLKPILLEAIKNGPRST